MSRDFLKQLSAVLAREMVGIGNGYKPNSDSLNTTRQLVETVCA